MMLDFSRKLTRRMLILVVLVSGMLISSAWVVLADGAKAPGQTDANKQNNRDYANIEVSGVVTSGVWRGVITMTGDVIIGAGEVITIAPGTEVRALTISGYHAPEGVDLRVELIVLGDLVVSGTATQPITVTSAAATPAQADWYGLRFLDGSNGLIEHCTIRYGMRGVSMFGNTALIMRSSIVRENLNRVFSGDVYAAGLYASGDFTLTIEDSTFYRNRSRVSSPSFGNTYGGNIYLNGGNTVIRQSQILTPSQTIWSYGGTAYGGGIYATSNGSLLIESSRIHGNRIHGDRNSAGGGLYLANAQTVISDTVITNNNVADEWSGGITKGGGLYIAAGTSVAINESTIAQNIVRRYNSSVGVQGGGIYSAGDLTLFADTLSGNLIQPGGSNVDGRGAGIYIASGTANIASSVIHSNEIVDPSLPGYGGGIYVANGQVQVVNSLIASNYLTAASGNSYGGGLYIAGGTVDLINNTIADNQANANGGGIYFNSGGGAELTTVTNTIISDSPGGGNCYIEAPLYFINGGNNIDSGASCGWASDNDSMSSTDPLLGPLADNGGPTQTFALLDDSPAIDAGDDATCAAAPINSLDQRGETRPFGLHCDIGAYEVSVLPVEPAPGGVTNTLTLWLRADQNVTVSGSNVTNWETFHSASATFNSTQANHPQLNNADGGQHMNFNFHPAIDFTEANYTELKATGLSDLITDTHYTLYIVERKRASFEWSLCYKNNTGNAYGRDTNWFRGPGASVNMGFSADVATLRSYVRADTAHNGGLNGAINTLTPNTGWLTCSSLFNNEMSIGSRGNGLSTHTGEYAEIIFYDTPLSLGEIQRVNSYLALKYGITLDPDVDYLDSESTVIYPSTGSHSDYVNDIAGIGIDNTSVLTQTISRSINQDSIVTISGTLSSMVAGEFLIWGNDNGTLAISTEVPAASPSPQRVTREWRMAETGEVGNVTISFDLTSCGIDYSVVDDFALLIDRDGDFSNASVTTGATVNGTVVSFSNVGFSDGDYFSLAYPVRNISSVSSGDWGTGSAWVDGNVPTSDDLVTISSMHTITLAGSANVCELLVEQAGYLVIDDGADLTVELAVTNAGTMEQTRTVNNTNVPFLEIQNSAATATLYRGVELDTTASGGNLGRVIVSVQELNSGEYCTNTGAGSPTYAERCYTIEPTFDGFVTNVRLWSLSDELNGILENDLSVFRNAGGSIWLELTSNRATGNVNGMYSYAEGEISNFSAFLLGQTGNAPNALTLQSFSAQGSITNMMALALSMLALSLGGLFIGQRRKTNS